MPVRWPHSKIAPYATLSASLNEGLRGKGIVGTISRIDDARRGATERLRVRADEADSTITIADLLLLIDLLNKSFGTPVRAIESSRLATHMQLRLAREP